MNIIEKGVYQILFKKEGSGFDIYIPGAEVRLQAPDIVKAHRFSQDAIVRDAIRMVNEEIPRHIPNHNMDAPIPKEYENYDRAWIVVDFNLLHKEMRIKAVRRNVTIPLWMDIEARRRDYNVSQLLQERLLQKIEEDSNVKLGRDNERE